MRIVLASASPRRRELLEQAGIDFEILIGSTRECITKEEPGEIVEELSLAKAKGVAEAVTGDAVKMHIRCLPCFRERSIRFIRA